jgi:hypothetical protein
MRDLTLRTAMSGASKFTTKLKPFSHEFGLGMQPGAHNKKQHELGPTSSKLKSMHDRRGGIRANRRTVIMTNQMDDETLHALDVIIADHFGEDPAGTCEDTDTDIEDLERLNVAYEIVAAWLAHRAPAPG